MDKFDKTACRELRKAMKEALDKCGVEGVTFDIGSMRFNDSEVTIKVVAKTEGNAQVRLDRVANMARIHGVGSMVKDGWSLVDYHSKKPKYPFIATGANGKEYKLTIAQAHARFGRTAENLVTTG